MSVVAQEALLPSSMGQGVSGHRRVHLLSIVESTVTGERMAADSVKDLAASRKCVAHLVATNLSLTVSDL